MPGHAYLEFSLELCCKMANTQVVMTGGDLAQHIEIPQEKISPGVDSSFLANDLNLLEGPSL